MTRATTDVNHFFAEASYFRRLRNVLLNPSIDGWEKEKNYTG